MPHKYPTLPILSGLLQQGGRPERPVGKGGGSAEVDDAKIDNCHRDLVFDPDEEEATPPEEKVLVVLEPRRRNRRQLCLSRVQVELAVVGSLLLVVFRSLSIFDWRVEE